MKYLLIFISLLFVQCASKSILDSKREVPIHYLSWVHGDLQNEYRPSRDLALLQLKRWEMAIPQMSDTEKYLAYLAVLDASGAKEEAEKAIKLYLTNYPQELRAQFLLGVHYMNIGKNELANYFFAQLEKKPEFQWKSLVYNNIGLMIYREKNQEEAIVYFEKAISANPPIAAPYVNLGAIYLKGRNYEKAEKMFRTAVKIDQDFEDAVLGLGVSLVGLKKYEEADKVYRDYIDSHPEAISVLYNRALVLGENLKRGKEASELMLQYIQKGGRETVQAKKIMDDWK